MKIAATYLPQNVKAFLQTIQWAEGSSKYENPYAVLFGGGKFIGYDSHPGICVPYGNTCSTAAGAYQILKGTYNNLHSDGVMPDFTPESQDAGAVALIKERGAYQYILAGDIEGAVNRLGGNAPLWASLPSSTVNQPKKSMEKILSTYNAVRKVGTDDISEARLALQQAMDFTAKNAVVIGICAAATSIGIYLLTRKKAA